MELAAFNKHADDGTLLSATSPDAGKIALIQMSSRESTHCKEITLTKSEAYELGLALFAWANR